MNKTGSYAEATESRAKWKFLCRDALDNLDTAPTVNETSRAESEPVECEVCSTIFRRESDKKRHKCVSERQKPISEQRGASQCTRCNKWFRSKGGMAWQCIPADQSHPDQAKAFFPTT